MGGGEKGGRLERCVLERSSSHSNGLEEEISTQTHQTVQKSGTTRRRWPTKAIIFSDLMEIVEKKLLNIEEERSKEKKSRCKGGAPTIDSKTLGGMRGGYIKLIRAVKEGTHREKKRHGKKKISNKMDSIGLKENRRGKAKKK